MYRNPCKAYENVDKKTMGGRDTEAAVLTPAALKLKDCRDHWEGENFEERLHTALRYNQQIWSIFQSELMADDNPLPKPLRIDLLRLAAFIDKRTFDIMAFPASEKLRILIEINNNIAAGLRERAAAA